jgi:hypothetical protein
MLHRTEGSVSKSSRRSVPPVERLPAGTTRNPVLSAVIFGKLADETGGATMNVHTGEVAKPHSPGYIVGGQPDRRGRRVPTEYEPKAGLDHILGHRQRIASGSDDAHASVGYWRDPDVHDSPYEVDASSVFRDRRDAVKTGTQRGEKSVWDLGKMKDIRLAKQQRRVAS